MEAQLVSLVEKGEVSITTEDVKRYETDCESFVKELRELITKDNILEDYSIIFFPECLNNLINLARKTDKYYLGLPLVAPLFSINQDSFQKRETKIPTKIRYMVLKM